MIDFKFNKKIKKAGFTLIEMLVAIFVFSIVMVIATGAIFSIVSANKTSQALKSVLDNLNSALDDMSGAMRYGSNYYCGGEDGLDKATEIANSYSTAYKCSSNGSSIVSFINKDGKLIKYKFVSDTNSGKIQISTDGGNFTDLTAPEVHVRDMHFYVTGATTAENYVQPQVLITLTGDASNGNNKSSFNIETMVTQRNPMCKDFMDIQPGHLGICKNN